MLFDDKVLSFKRTKYISGKIYYIECEWITLHSMDVKDVLELYSNDILHFVMKRMKILHITFLFQKF